MKTFYSLEDIEKLAAQGVRELVVDDDAVLTDLARNAAELLGVKLVARGSASAPSPVAPALAVTPGSGAKPRGCQHGPLTGPGPALTTARSSGPAGGLVDDLVGAVKLYANRAPAG